MKNYNSLFTIKETVSQQDVTHLGLIRKNVTDFMRSAVAYCPPGPFKLLDIAPQDHEGAKPHFPADTSIQTFDINPGSGCTYIGDLCKRNEMIEDNTFDCVVCTEVLEHTLQPFHAVDEMHRILKPGGLAFVSTPFNFRIHGPLPDCWRFTEHGLRALFSEWDIVQLDQLLTDDRFLMPIHYTLIARRRTKINKQ
jgi:SAM-dependent methyltransferase